MFLALFCMDDQSGVSGLVGGGVRELNKPGGGKKIHSVFDVLFPVPMFISRQNQSKWSERR